MAESSPGFDLSEITFVKRINIGSINPNNPVNEEQTERQMNLLNRCLNESPKGRIIGKDISVGIFQIGEHQLSLQRVTYHIGFKRQPAWLINLESEQTNPWPKQ